MFSRAYSFDSLKERVQTAQQGLTVGWKNIADKAKKDVKVVNKIARKALATEDGGKLRDGYVVTVDLNAGFDLFKVFQDNWVLFHKDSVINVNKAGEVDRQLNVFIKEWQKYESYLEEFLGNLSVLPEVVSNIEVIQKRCDAIGLQTQKVEDLILEYEDACERYELEKCKVDMKIKLSQLVETKHAEYTLKKSFVDGSKEVDAVTKEMSIKKIAGFPLNKQSEETEYAEKQKAYEDAFLDQMNQYIQYGEIEKPIVGSIDAQDSVSVEDININDSDLSTLREFLGPEEINSVIQAQASQNRSSKANENETLNTKTLCTEDASNGSDKSNDEINTEDATLEMENDYKLTADVKLTSENKTNEGDASSTIINDVIKHVEGDHVISSEISNELNGTKETCSDDEENEFFDAPSTNTSTE